MNQIYQEQVVATLLKHRPVTEWPARRFYYRTTRALKFDFYRLQLETIPVMTARAHEIVGEEFSHSGELLPIQCDGNEMFVYHHMAHVPCLSRVTFTNRRVLEFDTERLPRRNQLFRDTRHAPDLLYVEVDGGTGIRHAVRSNKLRGLEFKEVWTNQRPNDRSGVEEASSELEDTL